VALEPESCKSIVVVRHGSVPRAATGGADIGRRSPQRPHEYRLIVPRCASETDRRSINGADMPIRVGSIDDGLRLGQRRTTVMAWVSSEESQSGRGSVCRSGAPNLGPGQRDAPAMKVATMYVA
jgi:hypothetical protein